MNKPYEPFTSTEKNEHLSSGVSTYPYPYPNQEAHFSDVDNQYSEALLYSGSTQITAPTTGIFDRNGLLSPFSSGPKSRNYAITDFKITNPYRHYVCQTIPSAATETGIIINPSSLIIQSTYNFNLYSQSFRVQQQAQK